MEEEVEEQSWIFLDFDFDNSKWDWSVCGRGGSFSGNDGCVC